MERSELLKVAFILDEIIKKKKIIKYAYQNNVLIVYLPNNKKEIYNLGDDYNDREAKRIL